MTTMLCPVDGETLLMSERQGVEIDYCPRCRGVWLDRGELDKIIERSAAPGRQAHRNASAPADNRPSANRPQHRETRDDDDHRKSSGKPHRKKRSLTKSFLEDIFDFD